jgi:hypothetical protein
MMQENLFNETASRLNQPAGSGRDMRFQHKNDIIVLKRMLQQLVGELQSGTTFPIQPSFTFSTTRRPRLQRMVIYRPDDVRLASTMAFVAFISKRQHAPDAEVVRAIHDIDRELVTTMADVTDLLAYFSLELHSGQWYNLVLLREGSTKKQITAFSLHSYAAHELAPQYYAWIRLHHGLINGGLARGNLELQSTHYYTFSTVGSGADADGAALCSVEAGYGSAMER